MHMTTTADGLHGVVFGNFMFHERQIKNLTGFAHIRKKQLAVTRLAMVWYVVDNDLGGLRGLTLGAARVALLSA